MTLKDPKKILRDLFEKYSIREDNVVYADKIFIINTVINYIFKDKQYWELDKHTIIEYGELINKFLQEEVDIYWQDGVLMVRDRNVEKYGFEGG